MQTASSPVQIALTLDRGLCLEIEGEFVPLLQGWAPVAAAQAPLVPAAVLAPMAPGSAVVRVGRHAGPPPLLRHEEPHVRMGGAYGWIDDDRSLAVLYGQRGSWGVIALDRGRADIAPAPASVLLDPALRGAAAAELRSMCTIAVALLLGRREGALVAASAVIAPDGGGWLLLGDADSGKSTTVANLVTAGWSYLADEEVVLHAGRHGSVWLEGWPRALALDVGLQNGRATWTRTTAEPSALGRGRWRRTSPLAGIVSMTAVRGAPTVLQAATADDALNALVRATPWLLADRASSRYELGLLRSAARVSAWHLQLGDDVFTDVSRLAKHLRPLEAAS